VRKASFDPLVLRMAEEDIRRSFFKCGGPMKVIAFIWEYFEA
jgi:hypothetical protein